MKLKSIALLLATLGLAAGTLHAAGKTAGPNGGRIVAISDGPKYEFLVLPDRKVQLTFLGEGGKPADPADRTASAIGGDRTAPTRLVFTKSGQSLVSDKPLPEGKMIPIVLTVKTAPDAKSAVEKFNIDLSDCPTCEHQEYACTCAHGEEGHEGHDHGDHKDHDH